ncbi:Ig-like domain-containing protein, partial [Promineifilum sp.]|uniref:Ig-like domain-containing protein n=1 Tax=Promineifilum sp. TaxID=2664178 RepID=UPI0035B0B987
MFTRKSVKIIVLLLALLLVVAACRRGQQAEVPTPAATAATEGLEGGGETEATEPAATAETEAEPTAAPIVVQPVPPEAIDWPPQVITSDPLPGGEVAANAPITVRFDQPMDQASVEAAFSIEPAVTGELTWPEPETAVFTP